MRKMPRQERSRQMVERIIVAGRRVLVTDGYANFTTNRVAAAAQVSPGSLYQYFPDKASIIEVVIDRYWDEVSARVAASLAEPDDEAMIGDPLAAIRTVNRALVSALEEDAALMRILGDEMPPSRIRKRRNELEQRISDVVTTYLVVALRMPAAEAAARAWIIVVAMEALASRWVLDQPPAITREDLVEQLTALALGYLAHPL